MRLPLEISFFLLLIKSNYSFTWKKRRTIKNRSRPLRTRNILHSFSRVAQFSERPKHKIHCQFSGRETKTMNS